MSDVQPEVTKYWSWKRELGKLCTDDHLHYDMWLIKSFGQYKIYVSVAAEVNQETFV